MSAVDLNTDPFSDFVDRTTEMEHFSAAMTTMPKRILLVHGPSGIGKSSLLAKMMYSCAAKNVRKVEIVYNGANFYDYRLILKKAQETISSPPNVFDAFVKMHDDYFTRSNVNVNIGNVSVGNNMNAAGARIDEMKGVDLTIVAPRSDSNVDPRVQQTNLTEQFLKCLAQVNELVVIFVDGLEHMDAQTEEWFWRAFVDGVARLNATVRLLLVIGRQKKPELERELKRAMQFLPLPALALEDVKEYMRRRRYPGDSIDKDSELLLKLSRGNPYELANYVDRAMGEDDDNDDGDDA